MKHFLLCTLVVLCSTAFAQHNLLTFDSIGLPLDTFWNGQDTSIYKEGKFFIEAEYDTSFGGYWSSGIAISTMRDDTTRGFTNLYGSIAGSGHNSDAYGVVNASSKGEINVGSLFYWPVWMEGYVTNTTYAYYSMLEGDQFAKKFGGATGDDPDYFFVRFSFYWDSANIFDGSYFDFYLADFRFEDNSEDYIVDSWVYVDLNDYPVYEHAGYHMKMEVFSSDTGQFGINTPAFFCMDDFRWDMPGGVDEKQEIPFQIRVKELSFEVEASDRSNAMLLDMQGRLLDESIGRLKHELSTEGLPQGIYVIQLEQKGDRASQKVFRW